MLECLRTRWRHGPARRAELIVHTTIQLTSQLVSALTVNESRAHFSITNINKYPNRIAIPRPVKHTLQDDGTTEFDTPCFPSD